MKRILSIILVNILIACALTACGEKNASTSEASTTPAPESTAELSNGEASTTADSKTTSAVSESSEKRLKMTVNGREVIINLYDTPTANALYEALPMELSFSDYNGTEKIAYPPEKLPTEGEPDGCDPEVGDLCLYAPWGNLCVFYEDFRYSQSLIKLGYVESGMDILADASNDFTVTMERMN